MSGSTVAPEFVLSPSEMTTVPAGDAERDFESLLAGPAARVTLLVPVSGEGEEPDGEVVEAWSLLEEAPIAYVKKPYDEKLHPRWPKGSPNGKGGEFIQIGERFLGADGKPYEIEAIHGAQVVAQSASGVATDVKEVVLDTKKGKFPHEPAPLAKIAGDKSHGVNVTGAVTINPFVDSASHDPKLKAPASLHLSPEEWKRFGKVDQQHAIYVEERFGAWSPTKSKTVINKLKADYDAATQEVVYEALNSQYGGSSGHSLSMATLFSYASSSSAQKQYEKAKLLLRDTAEAVQWDLYHRTKAPDVAMFHWGHTSAVQQKKLHVVQGVPILSGYSMADGFLASKGFGDTVTAVPVAIRHVEMRTHSGGVHVDYSHEHEIATGARMKIDDRAFIADYHTMPVQVRKYLEKMAPAQHENSKDPASGGVLYEAKKALLDAGYDLPVPAEKPEITEMPSVGASATPKYKPLSPSIAKKAGEMIFDLKYKGTKEKALGNLENLGVEPGDFIEGMKGTRYVIIADPGDPTSNLRYVKIDPTTKLPDYNKSFPFNASAGNSFYRLDGHIDIPEDKPKKPEPGSTFAPFTDEQYGQLKDGLKTLVSDMAPGDMFKADGHGYKVVGPHGNKIQVESLEVPGTGSQGKMFLANGAFKTPKLVPLDTFVPPEAKEPEPWAAPKAPEWEPGDVALLTTPQGSQHLVTLVDSVAGGWKTVSAKWPDKGKGWGGSVLTHKLSAAPSLPGIPQGEWEVGDRFGHEGQAYRITSFLKDGTVRAKVSGGKVQKFSPEVVADKTVWRPSMFVPGNKAKLKDLDIGDVVHGGTGGKPVPYMLVGKIAPSAALGQYAWLRNLATGEESKVTSGKSYIRLLTKEDVAKHEKPAIPDDFAGWKEGPKVPLKEMEAGTWWKDQEGSMVHLLSKGDADTQWWVQKTKNGVEQDALPINHGVVQAASHPLQTMVPPSEAQVAAKPEIASKFDIGDFEHGPKVLLKDLPEGSLFLSATGLPMKLKSKVPKGGATALAMHNGKTVKNIPYGKEFTTLTEKKAFKKGDQVTVGELKKGDKFMDPVSAAYYTVDEPPKGDQPAKVSAQNFHGTFPKFYASSQAEFWASGDVSFGQVESGDVVPLSHLKPGDIFKKKVGTATYQLEAHAPGGTPMVNVVNKAGEAVAPSATKFGGDYPVVYLKPGEVGTVHADLLPKPPHFGSWVKVGPLPSGKVTMHVKDMPVGTVFDDMGSDVWTVKQAGGQAVITDGHKDYSIDGDWIGRVLNDAPRLPDDAIADSLTKSMPPQIGDKVPFSEMPLDSHFKNTSGDVWRKFSPTKAVLVKGSKTQKNIGAIIDMTGGLVAYELVPAPDAIVPGAHVKLGALPVGTHFKNGSPNGGILLGLKNPDAILKVAAFHPGGAGPNPSKEGNFEVQVVKGWDDSTPPQSFPAPTSILANTKVTVVAPPSVDLAPGPIEKSALPPQLAPNSSKMVKELPVGSFYAFEDDLDPSLVEVMKVVKNEGGTVTTATAGGSGHPSPDYKPEWVWVPEPDTAGMSAFTQFEKVKEGHKFSSGKGVYVKQGHGTLAGWANVLSPPEHGPGTSPDGTKKKFMLGSMVATAPESVVPDEGVLGSDESEQAKALKQFPPGSLIKFASPAHLWKVVGPGKDDAHIKIEKVAGPDTGGTPVGTTLDYKGEYANAGGSVHPWESPLKGYLHAKSGKYKYPKLSSLPVGTVFTDKKGAKYEVVEGVNAGYVLFEKVGPDVPDAFTPKQQHVAPGDTRVKVAEAVLDEAFDGSWSIDDDGVLVAA